MRHHPALFALALLAAPLATPRPAAAQDVELDYAVDEGGALYRIDCERLSSERVGQIEVPRADGTVERPVLSDLAATPDGYLYGIGDGGLYLINLTDPTKSRRIGDHGLTGPWGMCAVGATLLVNTSGGGAYLVDRRTAEATPLGPMGGPWVASGDIATLGARIVSSVKDGARREHLVTLDPQSGRATLVGVLETADGAPVGAVFGLIDRKGVLYGLTSDGAILRIDPATARCVVLRRTGIRWWGATSYTRI